MTTYKQNTPEQIWVSPEIYQEVLTSLDPFVRSGFEHTGNVNELLAVDGLPTYPECGHFIMHACGCESCFMSLEEIAREQERTGEPELERARR